MNAKKRDWIDEFVSLFPSDLMLTQINDIVASMMVLPNRQVFPLVQDIPVAHLRWSNPQVNSPDNHPYLSMDLFRRVWSVYSSFKHEI